MREKGRLTEQFLQRNLALDNVTVGVLLDPVCGDQGQQDRFLGLCLSAESVESCREFLLLSKRDLELVLTVLYLAKVYGLILAVDQKIDLNTFPGFVAPAAPRAGQRLDTRDSESLLDLFQVAQAQHLEREDAPGVVQWAVLQHLADSAESIMNSMPEICLITTDREPYVPVLDVAYNQPAARSAGVSRSDVSMSMLMANGGLPVSTYYDGNRCNTIYIKCLDDNGGVMDNLENVPIMQTVPDVGGALTEENMLKMRNGTLAKGDLIESMLGTKPVKQVSDGIDIEWETPVVPRYNGQRSQKVMCSPAPGIETENARKAEAAGMSDRNDVLKVEVKVNEGALNLKRTENAVRLAKMNLCHYNGYPLDSEVDVAESSLPESGSVSGSTAISGRPEYQMLDKKVQAAAQQVRMTRADALPQAGIFAGYGYTHGLTVNDETFIDKAGFSVGAKVSIPIFHFGEHYYKVKSDKSKYVQAVSERDSNYELMTLEMSKAANELDESEYERALAASNTASAEENVRVSRLHYDAGTETLSYLLEAQTLWQVANRDSVEADINHFLAWLSYLKTTGQICNEFIK